MLDSNWRRTDEIFLDVGPRFHAMTGAEPVLPEDLRPGDRLAGPLADDGVFCAAWLCRVGGSQVSFTDLVEERCCCKCHDSCRAAARPES